MTRPRRHATDDVDVPDRTLCGRAIVTASWEIAATVDNANPDCRACLRAITARLRKQ